MNRVPRRALRLLLGEFSRAFIDSQDVVPRKALEGGFQFRHSDLESLFLSIDRQPFEAQRRHAMA